MVTAPGLRPAAACLAAAACLSVNGCSAASHPAARGTSPGPAPSVARTPSPAAASPGISPVAPPVRPQATRGPAGQRRFARYVMALWGYALRTNDPSPLFASSFTKQACGGCARLASTLEQRRHRGWHVDFPGLLVRRVELRTTRGVTVAAASVTIPPSSSINDDGSFRSANPAHPHARFVVRMRFVHGSYRLLSFTLS
jgi:hypothetical protein